MSFDPNERWTLPKTWSVSAKALPRGSEAATLKQSLPGFVGTPGGNRWLIRDSRRTVGRYNPNLSLMPAGEHQDGYLLSWSETCLKTQRGSRRKSRNS